MSSIQFLKAVSVEIVRVLVSSKQDFEQVAHPSLKPLCYRQATEADVVASLNQTDIYKFNNLDQNLPTSVVKQLRSSKMSSSLSCHALEDTCFVYEKRQETLFWFIVVKPNLIPTRWGFVTYFEIVRKREDTKLLRVHSPYHTIKIRDLQEFPASLTDSEILCDPRIHKIMDTLFSVKPVDRRIMSPAQDLLSRFQD